MNSNLAFDNLEKIMDEYTSGKTLSPKIEEFLNDCELLGDDKRKKLAVTLARMKIDTVKKLETQLLRVGRSLVLDLLSSPDHAEKLTQKITAENVEALVQKYKTNHAIQLLSELPPKDQVKALNRAGIKVIPQLDPANELLMQRVINAVGTVMTGIGEKGGGRGEILIPMGGKSRR